MRHPRFLGVLIVVTIVGFVATMIGIAALVSGGGVSNAGGSITDDTTCTTVTDETPIDVGPLNGLVPIMAEARDYTYQTWPQVKTIGGLSIRDIAGTNTPSDHSFGLAIDIMTSNVALGNEIADYFATGPGHERFHVDNTIWNRNIHNDAGGWHPYTGENPHTDHVHVDTFASELGAPTPDPTGEAYDLTVPTIPDLDQVQTRNATLIVQEANKLEVGTQGATIGIAVALVEADLRNLASHAVPESLNYPHDTYPDGSTPAGDHDSVGIFQQRAGWASVESRMNVTESAHRFFNALLDTPGWQNMELTVAAQAVQVSAYPDAYGEQADKAATIVAAVSGDTVIEAPSCDSTGVSPVSGPGKPGVTGDWTVPLKPGSYTFNVDSFGSCGSLWANCHTGVDLSGNQENDPIYAAAAGTVTRSEFVGTITDPSYGWLVVIDHGGGIETYYAHQIRKPPVHVGQKVDVGDLIGNVGHTGNTTGTHLHYETRIDGVPVDPVTFMADKGAPL